MSSLWEASNGYIKIHQNCGGLVRWVEKLGDPHVGYTGDCLYCNETAIPVERIIPIEHNGDVDLHDAVKETPEKERARWNWNDERGFDENQERLRRRIIVGNGGRQ